MTQFIGAHDRVRWSPGQGPDVSVQAPGAALLVRPSRFHPNPATRVDNHFQTAPGHIDAATLARRAHAEVTGLADALEAAGVVVHVVDDEEDGRPDSVFPNNWLSTHADGTVAMYPMCAANRRAERRTDVLDLLAEQYFVERVVDFSGLERQGLFLEGTGAMVLDHVGRVAYVARSRRAHPAAVSQICAALGYRPILFDALDSAMRAIYHTNVLMNVGSSVALVGLELIPSPADRVRVIDELQAGGREIVELSEQQINEFAGNAIELAGSAGPVLVLSERAAHSLTAAQRRRIELSTPLVPVAVPTIELAGGSVRCMIAGIHLAARSAPREVTR